MKLPTRFLIAVPASVETSDRGIMSALASQIALKRPGTIKIIGLPEEDDKTIESTALVLLKCLKAHELAVERQGLLSRERTLV